MKQFMQGNEAIAEAAVRVGARMFAGYPITPTTEILEYLSWRLPEVGGTFVQAESEIASIHMVVGAATCGVRAITASSGPGLSLKQEGISVLADEQLPALIVNSVRYGNGIGTLVSAQCDYLRDTRGGGNGDYRQLVLCPSSVQEAVDLVELGFDLAEKYRMVCILMTEAALSHLMEDCTLPEFREPHRYEWGMDGHYSHPRIGIFDRDSVQEAKELMVDKYAEVKEKEQRWEEGYLEDAEYVFVSYGLPGRSTIGAVEKLREEGVKVGFIRPITVWPFPVKAFQNISDKVKGLITVETNATGQLVDDVALTLKAQGRGNIPVYTNPHIWGVPSVKEIINDYQKVVNGELKEVY